MTYVSIGEIIKAIIGEDIQFNITSYLRFAENDFIERTLCLYKYDSVNTEDLNEGALAATYTIPAGFIRFLKFEWEGNLILPAHLLSGIKIYQSDGDLLEGTPQAYQLEGETFRLIPMPSAHGYMTRWYVYKNTATDGTSPIIPSLEHEKLANYVVYKFYQMKDSFDVEKAEYFRALYKEDCANVYQRYKKRIAKQLRLYAPDSGGISFQSLCNIVEEPTY